MHTRINGLLIAALIMALSAGSAFAAGNGAVTTTTVVKDVVFTAPSTDSCHNEAPVTFQSVMHDVFHITERADGSFTVHALQTGTFTFTPDDPSIPATAGHISAPVTFNATRQHPTATFTQTLVGQVGDDPSDRRVFHQTAHFTITPAGDVVVDLDRIQVHCP
jgi:hypothetical protein